LGDCGEPETVKLIWSAGVQWDGEVCKCSYTYWLL
jgi:hypothetical protein